MTKYKRVLATVVASAMALSCAACGGSSGSGGSGSSGSSGSSDSKITASKSGTKDYIFAETEAAYSGIEGDINNMAVNGDTLYVITYEWVEGTGSEDGVTTAETEADTETVEEATDEVTEDTSDDTADAAGDETADESTEGAESTDDEYVSDDVGVDDVVVEDEEYEYVDGYSVNRLYSVPASGGEATFICEPNPGEDSGWIGDMFAYDDGVMLLLSKWDEDSGNTNYSGIVCHADGTVDETMDLSFISATGDDEWLSSVLVDGDGDFVVQYDSTIRVFSADGTKKSEYKSENSWIEGMGLTKDGQIVVADQVTDTEAESSHTKFAILDKTTGKTGDDLGINLNYLSSSDSISRGAGSYDFFYDTNSAMYGYSLSDGTATKVMDYTASDVDASNSGNKCMVSDTEMIIIMYNSETWVSELHKFEKVDPSEVADKTTLTLVSVYGNYDLKQAIINFNKTNDKYRINMIDYSEESDPVSKLSADIAAGDVPDMYDLSNGSIGGMTLEQCAAKGMLEDLTPYIEADSELSMDDFIPSVVDVLKVDGKLYYMASSFTMESMAARKSDVGDIDGWTFAEMLEYINSKDVSDGNVRLFYSTNKSDLLTTFLYNCLPDFVDWEGGSCSFDSEDFKSLLEVCNTGTDEETDYDENNSTVDMIRSGEMLFVDAWMSTDEIQLLNEMFDGDVAFVGYPNSERKGTVVSLSDGVAISSTCSDKDGAWQFVRQFLTKDYQGEKYVEYLQYSVPTRQDVYDMSIKALSTTEKYTDDYGHEIEPLESWTGWDDLEVEIGPMSDENIALFNNVIEHIGTVNSYDESVMDIITEEAAAYFSGDRTVDDVCDVIQNRMTTYINENR